MSVLVLALFYSFQVQAGYLDGVKKLLGTDKVADAEKKEQAEQRQQEIVNLTEKLS